MKQNIIIPVGVLIRRFAPKVKTYTTFEMERMLHGDDLPYWYRNVNGQFQPVTNNGEEPIRE